MGWVGFCLSIRNCIYSAGNWKSRVEMGMKVWDPLEILVSIGETGRQMDS